MSAGPLDPVGVRVGRSLVRAVALASVWDGRRNGREYVTALNQLVAPALLGSSEDANAAGRTVAALLLATVTAVEGRPDAGVSDESVRRLNALAAELEGGLPLEWALRRVEG